MISQKKLQHLLHYCPESGLFTWKNPPRTKAQFRAVTAGWLDKSTGYLRISINGKNHRAHRLAWLYVTGEWPSDQIDHVNGVRSDNRWSNLRPASNQENCRNQKKRRDNASGFKGVSFHSASGKWQAEITFNGVNYYLGRHDTPELASAYYEGAAALAFGNWKRVVVTKTEYFKA